MVKTTILVKLPYSESYSELDFSTHKAKMDQNGPFWPEGPFWSANRSLATPELPNFCLFSIVKTKL